MHMRLLLALAPLPLLLLAQAHAACSFSPGPGNDSHVCDSGSAASLLDTGGNNSLLLPAGGSGTISGNVTFGAGQDAIDIASGSIGGDVNQGAGIDTFTMSGGIIEGDLNQGDGLDRFQMTGGWIKGNYDSGDFAQMDGGRIGSVNMRLDENTFILRAGSIDRNIVTGFDKDFVEVFSGSVGGNISVSGGDDQVLIHGGQVAGSVLMSTGNDRFSWTGGRIGTQVDMGPGNDTAQLEGLASDALVIPLDAGSGSDALTFIASQPRGGAPYLNWERIELAGGSRFELDDTLRLGDADTITGTLQIAAGSTLASRQGTVAAFANGQRVGLNNAGTIDLSAGNDGAGRLLVIGDYNGDNGVLRLNSVLGQDGAASDRLVISQGGISGSTALSVSNLGGTGAATQGNGIQVVEARDGATGNANAFIQTQTLSAGAYDYRLFKGGITAGSENNWYLRSTLVAPPAPAPGVDPPSTPPVAAPAPGQAALPAPVAGRVIPLYRPEVAVYAAAPRSAAIVVRQALGTFQQRQGDQQWLDAAATPPATWGQAYGSTLRQQWSGTVTPTLDGNLYGFKVGQDLYVRATDDGHRQHAGLYLSHGRLDGDVRGFALGREDSPVGNLELKGDSLGAYWTWVGPAQGYVDAVLQYTHLDGRARSDRGDRLDLDGHAWAASVEGGYPLALTAQWSLEPQAQLIAQRVSLDSASDRASRVAHDAQVEWLGRLGLRLEGMFPATDRVLLQPFAQVNLWHADGGADTLTFNGVDRIDTDYRYTALQLEGGLAARLGPALSLHAGLQYSTNLDSRQQQASGVNLGLRWQF
ncbi:autotransporter outer membrane beta-barrel domain-containing protein [Pseudomonas sp. zfem004]|uniref:autotransporter family protein n=1 Tax=Pseudomonas sp. zfem004 TaxID=3078199 RepID=UPI002928B756|nr:autotransporter outer membrane beta-barrel domain-containing protein [Pseudomonas sp. zfem004]MDU9403917.1 autotransporter outer membrane beta-barrel domain-containing protein [Pseudomonas sp. zfem004]